MLRHLIAELNSSSLPGGTVQFACPPNDDNFFFSMSENAAPTSPPAHEIILVRALEERQKCFDVRFQVFHKEQGFSPDAEIDQHEDKAAHFLLRLTPSLTPIGTIRCVKFPSGNGPSSSTYYKLTRLAVLKDYRRYRFGRALVLALHDWVRHDALKDGKTLTDAAHGLPGLTGNVVPDAHPSPTSQSSSSSAPSPCTSGAGSSSAKIVVHSQIPVKGFYVKFGYELEGEEFDEDGDPHQKMVLRLPLIPDRIHAH